MSQISFWKRLGWVCNLNQHTSIKFEWDVTYKMISTGDCWSLYTILTIAGNPLSSVLSPSRSAFAPIWLSLPDNGLTRGSFSTEAIVKQCCRHRQTEEGRMDLKHRNKQENVLYSAAFQLVIMVQRLGLSLLWLFIAKQQRLHNYLI